MNDKSHVSMEERICIVCGKYFDTGSILLHKQLKQVLDRKTATGYGLCPEDKELHEKRFLALVEIDDTKSKVDSNLRYHAADVYRTGEMCHIKYEVAKKVFKVDFDIENQIMVFAQKGVIDELKKKMTEK